MRTHIFIAALAFAAAPALAQTASPADPNAAPASQAAPATAGSAGTATPGMATTPGTAASGQAAAATGGAAAGDATAQLTTGAMVYDTQGGQVGTIEAVNGTDVVVSTGTTKAAIPATSFGRGTMGPVLSLTRAQLEAAVTGGGSGGR